MRLSLRGAEDPVPPLQPLPMDIALGLYRIVQEALANTARHAGARSAHVTLRIAAREAHLVVSDDGAGFDPEAARRRGGLGLASLEERAALLGGRCRIASAPGAGTEVEIAVPLPAAAGALAQVGDLARRHRGLVTSTALVILALAAGLVTTLFQARRARLEATRAEQAVRFLEDLFEASDPLALLLRKRGRPAEAAALLERSAATVGKVYGPEHPEHARILLNLGLARSELGEDQAARHDLERALAIYERTLEPSQPRLVRAIAALADHHLENGRYAEAEPLFRRLMKLRDEGATYEAWDTVLANWAQLLRATGREGEAAQVR